MAPCRPRHSKMDVTFHPGPAPLMASASAYLRQERFSANVLAVMARRIADGGTFGEAAALWATVDDGGEVVGAAMQTPPWNLFLPRMAPAAAVALADAIADAGRALPGLNGETRTAESFASRWHERTGQGFEVRLRQRLYVLGELVPPAGVTGGATRAAAPDLDLVAGWAEAFHQEAQPEAPGQDWRDWARSRIDAGRLHLWRTDGTAVAMAAVSPAAGGVARVGPVHTPPGHRRRGYGSAVTAAATAAAIAGGAEDVVLYTDLANPTSNAIYQAIGYLPDHDAVQLGFV